MAAAREQAKHRHRRIIFNSDGNDVNVAGVKTAEDFLAVRYNHLLHTNVDSVFYCTGATTMFTHLAQVGETYGEFITDESQEEGADATCQIGRMPGTSGIWQRTAKRTKPTAGNRNSAQLFAIQAENQ